MRSAFTSPTECPVCGADVPRGAKACPECGADERSGWDEEATRYDGLDLPDDSAAEDASGASKAHPLWLVVTIVLLLVIGLTFVFR